MKGNGAINVIGQNLHAVSPNQQTKQWMSRQFKMCWKCQKDKSPVGSKMKTWVGGQMFICKECVDAKETKEKST